MNVYVETNFVLELTFEQEQAESCDKILRFCEAGRADLVIPAYSLAEPHEKLVRQERHRRNLQQLLNNELRQLSRTASYSNRIKSIQDLANLMIQSNEDEQQRFIHYRERFFNSAEVISLTVDILREAASFEAIHDLSPQDALVYTSVIKHLRHNQSKQACFLNRNIKDFDSPDIIDELAQLNCRMIFQFEQGYRFLQSHLS